MDNYYTWIFIIPPIVGFFGTLLWRFLWKNSNEIKNNFARLGDPTGRTYIQIISVVGKETSSFSKKDENGNNITVRQWIGSGVGGYHVVLRFDANDICLGVSYES